MTRWETGTATVCDEIADIFLNPHIDPHVGVHPGLLEETRRHGATEHVDLDICQPSLLVVLQHGEDSGDLLHCHP